MIRRPPRSTLFPTRRSSDLAFKAVMDGKQVAVLAPTTVLAFQHYRTFLRRFASFPVTIELLTRYYSADRKSTRLNSSHSQISYAVFCLKKKKNKTYMSTPHK